MRKAVTERSMACILDLPRTGTMKPISVAGDTGKYISYAPLRHECETLSQAVPYSVHVFRIETIVLEAAPEMSQSGHIACSDCR